MIKNLLIICSGASIGASLRYIIGLLLISSSFPLATTIVNIAGCFCIGVFWTLLSQLTTSENMKLFLIFKIIIKKKLMLQIS